MRNLRRKFAPRPNIVLASFKFYPPPAPFSIPKSTLFCTCTVLTEKRVPIYERIFYVLIRLIPAFNFRLF